MGLLIFDLPSDPGTFLQWIYWPVMSQRKENAGDRGRRLHPTEPEGCCLALVLNVWGQEGACRGRQLQEMYRWPCLSGAELNNLWERGHAAWKDLDKETEYSSTPRNLRSAPNMVGGMLPQRSLPWDQSEGQAVTKEATVGEGKPDNRTFAHELIEFPLLHEFADENLACSQDPS